VLLRHGLRDGRAFELVVNPTDPDPWRIGRWYGTPTPWAMTCDQSVINWTPNTG
jgi:hypothetical protein